MEVTAWGWRAPSSPLTRVRAAPSAPLPSSPPKRPCGRGGRRRKRTRRGRRVGLALGSQGPGPSRPAAARSARVQPADVREAPRPRAPSSPGAARAVPTEGSRYFQMCGLEAAWGTSFPDAQPLSWGWWGEGALPPPASGVSQPGFRPSAVVRAQMGSGALCLGPWPPPQAIYGPPTPRSQAARALTKTSPVPPSTLVLLQAAPTPRAGRALVLLWPFGQDPFQASVPHGLWGPGAPCIAELGRGAARRPLSSGRSGRRAGSLCPRRPGLPAGGTVALPRTLLGARPPCPPHLPGRPQPGLNGPL